ncbi:SDR family oxidoreductase [Solirubrobacter ginsenosidimutans]|uniref:SDR family oxidoreductase n=1 Tax=Solirubrobacter ginsenosidimutans TaxID=490573 RepID=A0A9X3MZR7_9ACTN|nr:SDR family oxidoreductase [Solirubrobacter ginsenosidimutans]MDA0166041.1 SDR family oxidoreductase [Solirubrobacter ginsenosidimutans]
MNVKDKVAVVTGGASGIGLALSTRFAQEGAHVVLSDLRQDATERAAAAIGAYPVAADVGREEDIKHLVEATIERFGRVDLFVSNAGIAIDGGLETTTEQWQKIIGVNLMSEIYAAKYAIPHMLEQGSGYLLNVASAAGLLVIYDTVSYTVTKHAAIGFTEWLASMYEDSGIGVSVLVPAAVRTPILAGKFDTPEGRDAITTDKLADIVMDGLAEERFLINTHPWVLDKFAVKGRDYEQYIAMMRAGHAAELART